tara:strand:- start:1606 stop:2223 length:618 start_codon:yes stop_codon:yes gene_type:complete
MIVIGGTQRSGTSLLTTFVKDYGFNVGTDFWHQDINGGLESPIICNYISKKMNLKEFPFKSFNKIKHNTIYEPEIVIQKFSFLLMDSRFIKHLSVLYPDLKLLITQRNEDKVIKSKKSTPEREKRFKGDHPILKQSSKELKTSKRKAIKEIQKRRIQNEQVEFDDIINKPKKVVEKLNLLGLGIDLDKSLNIFNRIIDKTKITIK